MPEGTEPKVWERMTVCAPLYDVQSTGAVRSYAAKYWLRAKLLIGTGEPDSEARREPPQPAEVSQPTRRRKTLPKPKQAPQKPAVPCSVHGDKGDKCDWLRQAVLILIQETKPEEATRARWREAYGPAAQLVCWQLEAVRDEIREKT